MIFIFICSIYSKSLYFQIYLKSTVDYLKHFSTGIHISFSVFPGYCKRAQGKNVIYGSRHNIKLVVQLAVHGEYRRKISGHSEKKFKKHETINLIQLSCDLCIDLICSFIPQILYFFLIACL